MPLPTPEFPVKLLKAAGWTAGAVDFVPITLSGDDIDLTDPEGPTGGYSCRAVQIGGTPGNLVVVTLRGEERTVPVAANSAVQLGCCVIGSSGSGTTCTPVGVYL